MSFATTTAVEQGLDLLEHRLGGCGAVGPPRAAVGDMDPARLRSSRIDHDGVGAHRGATLNLDLADGEGGRTQQVTVPPGVCEGQKLRLRGRGGKGRGGGADGDIYLHITLAPHPVFRADKHDLHFGVALAPWEAALGADVEVPTLDGPVLLTVPHGSRSGRKLRLRLRGRGLANGRGGHGDLYAAVHIDVPATLSVRERELYEELARVSSFDARAVATKEMSHETVTS